MEINLYTMLDRADEGKEVVNVSDHVFAASFNESLIHQAVTAYLAGRRVGTRSQKNRAQVKGGKSKPWRQKGTGRARAGSMTSPLWRGGGVTFAAQPTSYSQKLNKKMYRGALRSILSELVRQSRLLVVEQFSVEKPKTSFLVKQLRALGVRGSVLFVTEEKDENLFLAARNLPGVKVTEVKAVDPISLINFENVLMTIQVLKKVEEKLA